MRWPRSSWCDPRARRGDHRQVGAVVTVVTATIGSTVLGATVWMHQTGGWTHLWPGLALELGAALALLGARRAPVLVAAVVAAVAALILVPGTPLPGWAYLARNASDAWLQVSMAALGTIAALLVAGLRRRIVWAFVGVVSVLAAFASGRHWHASLGGVAVGLLGTATPALIGTYLVARSQLIQALVDRAERAEAEQHLLAEQARAEERQRIAADMHDVVTHRVSLMVLQAGALQVTTTDDGTRRAAEDLRVTGCLALEELRDAVAVLGAGPAGHDSTPPDNGDRPEADGAGSSGPEDLATLAGESASVGTPVQLSVSGDARTSRPSSGERFVMWPKKASTTFASTPRERRPRSASSTALVGSA